MALRWGNLINSILDDIDKGYKSAASSFKTEIDTATFRAAALGIKAYKENVDTLNASIASLKEKQNQLRAELEIGGLTIQEEIQKKAELNQVILDLNNTTAAQVENNKQLAAAEEKRTKDLEKTGKSLKRNTDAQKKYSRSIDQVADDYDKAVLEILTSGEDLGRLDDLKFEMIGNKIMSGIFNNDSKSLIESGAGQMGGAIANKIASIGGPVAAIIGSTIGKAFEAAVKQVMELNNALVGLQREMGGVINASNLGFDAFGNSTRGMGSLTSQTLAANVSVAEFGNAIKSLGPNFGQTIGMTNDLKNSAKDMTKFGIEAARMQKLYGAEIGGSVANLSQNFGMSIGDATDYMVKGAQSAKALGLNVGQFTKNMEAVTNMVGDVYFQSIDAMSNMATIATQLGTSVSAIAGAVPKMQGINDLFKKQQELSALGMSSTSAALGRIYALQKQGRSDEAARLSLASQAKDLQAQGLTDSKGNVSQQGIDTLKASGMGQEQIVALQKMSQQAQRTGLTFDQLGGQVELTKAQQRKLAEDEKNNITLEEQGNQILGSLKQAFIDPLAAIIGPVLKGLMNAIQPIAKAIGSVVKFIFDAISPIVGFFMTIFDEVSKMFQDVYEPIASLFANVGSVGGGFFQTLKDISSFLAKVFMAGFRVVSKIIGGVISVFAKLWGVVAEKLGPIFEGVSSVFKDGMAWIEDSLGWITDAFGFIADLLGNILGGIIDGVIFVFKGLGTAIGWVIDAFMFVVNAVVDFLSPAFEFLGDILSPIIDAFKWLWDTIVEFTDWLASWIPGLDGGEEEAAFDASTLFKDLGTAEVDTPVIPVANAAIDFGQNQAAMEAQKLNKEQNQIFTNTGVPQSTPNIVVNTQVDGLISNKQSVKSPN